MLVFLGSSAPVVGQKPAPKKQPAAITDPAAAGPDFKVQGEYASEGKLGAQVVAKGDGKFEVYFLAGGLPGAGWDGKTRTKASGATTDGKTAINGSGWNATLADGKLIGTMPDGGAFTLKRVERQSPTAGAKPPAKAVVLFDGTHADEWAGGKVVEEKLLFCGTKSKQAFAAGKYHVEFRTPFQPKAGGQGRGNSGVYILGKEIQVLDSFGLTGAKNECGAFYGQAQPSVNMCLPPLTWQTYDVDVKADATGGLVATVLHNGVKVHENFPIAGKGVKPASISLQNHGNPVVYRNIWVVPE
jgi:hypothetical protein